MDPGEDAHLDALFTDRSDASGTLYFDAASNTYRRDLLARGLQSAAADEPAPECLQAAARIVLPAVLGPQEAAKVKASHRLPEAR